ncbi:MAG: N-acetyltransferase, partial [Bacteroidetes bacterium]|nr:N-acetyltransferase [Bacteroidota bacterium]
MIRAISAAETRPMRSLLLRPGQPPENLVYPGDDHPDAFHGGAFEGERLV